MRATAPSTPKKPRHIRIPPFVPVPLRAREDGWTPFKQAAFLVALLRSGSVSVAAGEVGRSRASAYLLRRRAGAESFAGVWDLVLAGAGPDKRKVTPEERFRAATEGRIKPLVWQGRCIAIQRKTDAAAFRGLLLRAISGARMRARAGRK